MHIFLSQGVQSRIVQILLRPVVRFCLRHMLSYGKISERLKVEFVLRAAGELEKSGEKVTASQISVMTGISRRDVSLILTDEIDLDEEHHYIKRLLSRWETNDRFSAPNAKPRVLSYKGRNGFQALVANVSKDLSAAAVRKELLRLGLIKETNQGISLQRGFVTYAADPDRTLDLFSRDMDTFTALVEENVTENPDIRNPHFRTAYDNLFLDAMPEVKAGIMKESKLFHRKIRRLLAKFDADINPEADREGGGSVAVVSIGHASESSKR